MPSPSFRGQFLRCQPPTSSISASSRLRILMTTRVFQILVLLMSKFSLLVNSGECLGIMLSSTKIRLFYSLSFYGQEDSDSGIFRLQGFVVKLFEKTWEEGCNLVTAYHQGEKYENYNVSFL